MVFSEVTGAGWGLKNIDTCPLFVAHSANAMYGDSAGFILREFTGIRLRKRHVARRGEIGRAGIGFSVR